MRKIAIINRYKGSVDWTNKLNFEYIIYNKLDPLISSQYYKTDQENTQEYYKRLFSVPGFLEIMRPKSPDLNLVTNVGHDASTFFYHIVNNFEDLADINIFLHENPFHHYHNGDFIQMLNGLNEIPDYMDWGQIMLSDRDGGPTDRCPVGDVFHHLFPDQEVPDSYTFVSGSLFALSKASIHRLGIKFFKTCIKVTETEPLAPWAFERLYFRIFTETKPNAGLVI